MVVLPCVGNEFATKVLDKLEFFFLFEDDVFAQTVEQYSILLKTRDLMSISKVLASKLDLTLFIWQSLEKHEDTTLEIWLL